MKSTLTTLTNSKGTRKDKNNAIHNDDPSLTYETCKYHSPSGQISFTDEDDPEYEDYTEEELEQNQKIYDEFWNYYFGNI